MSVLFVPILPVSLNDWSRSHWGARKREADRWRDAVAAVVAQQHPEPIRGPARVCLTFYWADRLRHDASNGGKLVLDAIVSAGLIRDDGPPWLVEECYRSRLAPSRDRTGVVVQIHQADAPAWPLPVARKRKPKRPGVQPPATQRDPGASLEVGGHGNAPAGQKSRGGAMVQVDAAWLRALALAGRVRSR